MNKRSYESSFENPRDIYILILSITLTIILRILIKNIIGRRIWNKTSFDESYKNKLKRKFEGSFYRAINYSIFFITESFLIRNQNWLFNLKSYVEPWYNIPISIKFIYFMELSYYMTSSIFLFVEPKLSDFYQMLLHHIITILLIYFSYDNK